MTNFLTLKNEGPPEKMAKQLCCGVTSEKNRQGLLDKAVWIRARQSEELIFTKIGDPESSDKVFVEYLPIEVAWSPIEGRNYMHVNCLWVSGSHEGQGSGKKLLQRVFDDARVLRMNGITALTTPKKAHT